MRVIRQGIEIFDLFFFFEPIIRLPLPMTLDNATTPRNLFQMKGGTCSNDLAAMRIWLR
jgi:hypothetical protein